MVEIPKTLACCNYIKRVIFAGNSKQFHSQIRFMPFILRDPEVTFRNFITAVVIDVYNYRQ